MFYGGGGMVESDSVVRDHGTLFDDDGCCPQCGDGFLGYHAPILCVVAIAGVVGVLVVRCYSGYGRIGLSSVRMLWSSTSNRCCCSLFR